MTCLCAMQDVRDGSSSHSGASAGDGARARGGARRGAAARPREQSLFGIAEKRAPAAAAVRACRIGLEQVAAMVSAFRAAPAQSAQTWRGQHLRRIHPQRLALCRLGCECKDLSSTYLLCEQVPCMHYVFSEAELTEPRSLAAASVAPSSARAPA